MHLSLHEGLQWCSSGACLASLKLTAAVVLPQAYSYLSYAVEPLSGLRQHGVPGCPRKYVALGFLLCLRLLTIPTVASVTCKSAMQSHEGICYMFCCGSSPHSCIFFFFFASLWLDLQRSFGDSTENWTTPCCSRARSKLEGKRFDFLVTQPALLALYLAAQCQEIRETCDLKKWDRAAEILRLTGPPVSGGDSATQNIAGLQE